MERYFDINEPGMSIKAKIYCDDLKSVSRVVIYGHGFGGHKDNKAAEKFAKKILSKYKHLAVLTYDFPAHGDDVRKKLKFEDCMSYLTAVCNYCRTHFNTDELYGYATSFGGYLFLRYIHEYGNPFKKVVLRCPAIQIRESLTNRVMKNDDYQKLQKGKEVQVGFDRKINIDMQFLNDLTDITQFDYLDYAEDILILHGTKDEVVSFDDAYQFADNNIIEFIPIENADHRFSNSVQMELANKYIMEFFKL